MNPNEGSYNCATDSTASTMKAGRNGIGARSEKSKLGEAGRKGQRDGYEY